MTIGIETEGGPAALEEEARRLRQLRVMVDLTANILMQAHLTHAEAVALLAATRERALALFPDKAETYDLILAPRFARLVREFVDGPDEKVLPFPRRPLAD
jgi:hypothetical protein